MTTGKHEATAEVLARLDALDALFTSIRQVVDRHDLERRKVLIDLRRRLGHCIGEIDHAGSALFNGTVDESLFHRQLADLRYRLAHHQAEWPAVAIEDSEVYRASANAIITFYEDFARWVRGRVPTVSSAARK